MKKLSIFIFSMLIIVTNCLSQVQPLMKHIDGIAWYFSHNQNGVDDIIIDAYAHDYFMDTYKEYKNDEFEWNDKLSEINNKWISLLSNNNDVFSIVLKVELGNYDFSKQAFTVKFNEGLTCELLDNVDKMNSVDLLMNNLYKFTLLPMEKEKANAFLKSRKDFSGNVNREIFVRLNIKLLTYDSNEYQNYSNKFDMYKYTSNEKYPSVYPVLCNVLSAEAIDESNNKQVPLGQLSKE